MNLMYAKHFICHPYQHDADSHDADKNLSKSLVPREKDVYHEL